MRLSFSVCLLAATLFACDGKNLDNDDSGGDAGGSGSGGQTGGGAGGGTGGGDTGGTGGEAAGGEDGAGGEDAAGGAGGEDAAGGAGGEVEKNPVGAECESEVDCESNFCLDSTFARAVAMDDDVEIPGGYCSNLTCRMNADCGDGALCVDLEGSGLDVPFDACFKSCDGELDPAENGCRADHLCYCDPDDNITDIEGTNGHCLCIPEVLVGVLSGD